MLKLKDRKCFECITAENLIAELKELPPEMMVNFNGCATGYLHVDYEENCCCFDDSDLSELYEEMDDKVTEDKVANVYMFEVGKLYTTSDWTIGGLIRYAVKDRNKTQVYLVEHFDNVDGIGLNDCGWHDVLTYNGTEYVLLGKLNEYEHRLYATE